MRTVDLAYRVLQDHIDVHMEHQLKTHHLDFCLKHQAEYSQLSTDLPNYLILRQICHPEGTHLTLTDRPSLIGLPVLYDVIR